MKKLYRTTEEINGHKFYRTYNFLPESERKQLIKEIGPFIVNRPYVKDYGPVPGYNTPDDMQDNPIFKEFHKKVQNEKSSRKMKMKPKGTVITTSTSAKPLASWHVVV